MMAASNFEGKPGALMSDSFVVSQAPDLSPKTMIAEARSKAAAPKRRWIRAGVPALALSGLGLFSALWAFDHTRSSQNLAEQVASGDDLSRSVKSLKARLDAADAAKGRDETAELRKSIGELKSSLAALRDAPANGAPAGARIDKIERDLAKLGDRFDKEGAASRVDVAARLDRLEKKSSPASTIAAAAPAAGISKETTGSISVARPVIREWALLEVRDGVAIIEGRDGFRQVALGDILPGSGRVEKIERRAHGWAVITAQGEIVSAPN